MSHRRKQKEVRKAKRIAEQKRKEELLKRQMPNPKVTIVNEPKKNVAGKMLLTMGMMQEQALSEQWKKGKRTQLSESATLIE